MFFLSRQTVTPSPSLYAGSFVALAVGVFLLGLAATATAATIAYDGPAADEHDRDDAGQAGPAHQQVRIPLSGADASGLQIVLSMVGTISGFITIFVIASTFAFAVASRRREIGLLRLIGATPSAGPPDGPRRGARRRTRGARSPVPYWLSWRLPCCCAKASYTELAPVKLEPASPWLPLGDRGLRRVWWSPCSVPGRPLVGPAGSDRSTRCGRPRWNRRGSDRCASSSGCSSWPGRSLCWR